MSRDESGNGSTVPLRGISVAASAAAAGSIDKELDLSNTGRGVWLVKVPKYIANKWEKAPGTTEVGKLKIVKQQHQKAQVLLTLSDAVINLDPHERIPREHRLDVSDVTKQTLGVFSHMIRKSYLDTVHSMSSSTPNLNVVRLL